MHCKKIQASGGPVTDEAVDEIIFRGGAGRALGLEGGNNDELDLREDWFEDD